MVVSIVLLLSNDLKGVSIISNLWLPNAPLLVGHSLAPAPGGVNRAGGGGERMVPPLCWRPSGRTIGGAGRSSGGAVLPSRR